MEERVSTIELILVNNIKAISNTFGYSLYLIYDKLENTFKQVVNTGSITILYSI